MSDPRSEKPGGLEKVNQLLRIILAVVTVGILIVAVVAMMTRGTGY